MKVWRSLLIIIAALACASNSVASAVNDRFNHQLTQMIKSNLPDATVGVILQDAKGGEVLYSYNGNKHFLPASTTKLLTAAAALKLLGPDYHYDTSLFYRPSALKFGMHHGDIGLQFSGDPSLKSTTIHSLLQKLSNANIAIIKGDLIIDDSIYTGPLLGLGWTCDSTAWYYAAPVAAIIIDKNQFGVTLLPVSKIGGKVAAILEKEYIGSKFRTLNSDIIAATFEDSENLCQLSTLVDEKNNVDIGGCWPVGTQPVHLRLAVKNPRLQAQQLVKDGLDKLKIKVTGKIRFAPIPNNLTKLAYHSSEPLHALLKPILNESNNLYAETVVKTLGAKVFETGSFKTGTAAVQQILSEMTGIDFSQTRILDGSGSSRYNLVTPGHLSRLLYTMQQQPHLQSHFRSALAMSGVNGTLKNRFTSVSNAANIQAKTGTLSGVSTLAGYFTTNTKRELIITIMINHALESNILLKQFEEDICSFVIAEL